MEEAGDGPKTSSQDARGRRAQAQGMLRVCMCFSRPFVLVSNLNRIDQNNSNVKGIAAA